MPPNSPHVSHRAGRLAAPRAFFVDASRSLGRGSTADLRQVMLGWRNSLEVLAPARLTSLPCAPSIPHRLCWQPCPNKWPRRRAGGTEGTAISLAERSRHGSCALFSSVCMRIAIVASVDPTLNGLWETTKNLANVYVHFASQLRRSSQMERSSLF